MDTLQQNYNERLFSSGLRRRYHFARYHWLRRKLTQHGCSCRRVLELGCFDAKTIEFLPAVPEYYLGYDADWEGGLQAGRKKWANAPSVELRLCTAPDHLASVAEPFDVAVCMETVEHLPQRDLDAYLAFLSRSTNGWCFFTIPVESGLLFLLKYLYKRLHGAVTTPYRFRELLAAMCGMPSRVQRIETSHKGFDYRDCLARLKQFFDLIEVEGIPFSRLSLACNLTIGITTRKRADQAAGVQRKEN